MHATSRKSRWVGSCIATAALICAITACGSDDDGDSSPASTPSESPSGATSEPDQGEADTTDPGTTASTDSSVAAGPDIADPEELVSVEFSTFPATVQTFLPQLAFEEGFFRDHNLDVSFLPVTTGPDLATALISGSSQIGDVGLAIIGPLIVDQGEDMSVLLGNINMNYSLLLQTDVETPNEDAPFPENIQDLEGLTIGVTAFGTLTEDFARRLVAAAGLDPDSDVTFIATGGATTMVPAFQQGQVDALVTFPPVDTLLGEEGVDYKVMVDTTTDDLDGLFDGYLVDVYAGMTGWIEDNASVAVGFCRGMKDAYDFALDPENIDAVASSLGAYVGLDPTQAAEVWEAHKNSFTPVVSREVWDRQSEFSLSGSGVPDFDEHVYAPCQEVFTD